MKKTHSVIILHPYYGFEGLVPDPPPRLLLIALVLDVRPLHCIDFSPRYTHYKGLCLLSLEGIDRYQIPRLVIYLPEPERLIQSI